VRGDVAALRQPVAEGEARFPRCGREASIAPSAKRAPSKPILACVPSQNGFFDELPQRHSANVPRAGRSFPSGPHRRHGPRTRYGPFFATSIVVPSVAARALMTPKY
jgi:hypothetical protein